MAATHRIPLIDFSQYHFWRDWEKQLPELEKKEEREACKDVHEFARKVCRGMAVAVTNTGQLLFLVNVNIKMYERECGHYLVLYCNS